MKVNIEVLLEKIPEGSLAYELVSLLREHQAAEWGAALKTTLEERVQQEIRRLSYGQDQATGD